MSMDLHPPLNAFVFVCICVAAGSEVLRVFRNSTVVRFMVGAHVSLAAVFAVFAFVSGLSAAESASEMFEVSDDLIGGHYEAARLLLFVILPCPGLYYIALQAKHSRALFAGLFRAVLLAAFGLVLYSGYLGGKLVFSHGAGVKSGVLRTQIATPSAKN